jgi:hypothetical protein
MSIFVTLPTGISPIAINNNNNNNKQEDNTEHQWNWETQGRKHLIQYILFHNYEYVVISDILVTVQKSELTNCADVTRLTPHSLHVSAGTWTSTT